jgi:glycerol-3-phosphate acyltransferase PlsY
LPDLTSLTPDEIKILLESCVLSMLFGSLPFGFAVGLFAYGSDIRKSGSGNIGAANALRSYGKFGGAIVLVMDVLKGYVATIVALTSAHWASSNLALATAIAALAVVAHCFSPWLRFKGGKGVATWLGVLCGLSWIAGAAFIAIWLAAVIPTRYSSLGSIIASVLSPVALWLLFHDVGVSVVAALVALLIVWKHRDNIARLRAGSESKIALRRAEA